MHLLCILFCKVGDFILKAGFAGNHIGNFFVYVVGAERWVVVFVRCRVVFGQYFARARPTATAMVVGLIDPRMKIEIQVTAKKR